MSKKIKAEEYMNWGKTITGELTPLEALKRYRQYLTITDFDIIEKALKDYQTIKIQCVSELLNEISREYVYRQLKALAIIKYKWVNVDLLIRCHYVDVYNMEMRTYAINHKFQDLTQQEYDLLKEVLL